MTDGTEPTNAEEAVRFLEWHSPGGPWPITTIIPDDSRTPTKWLYTAADVVSFVEANSGRTNIFYTVGTVRTGVTKKPSKSDIVSTKHLHADIDPPKDQPPADPEKWVADTLAQIKECSTVPRPSYIGRSGNGLHLLWKLDGEEFNIGGADGQIEAIEAYNRGIMLALGADKATINVDRLLRLPGTINLPNKNKRERGRTPQTASILDLNDAVYSLADFPSTEPEQVRRAHKGALPTAKAEREQVRRLDRPVDLEQWGVPEWIHAVIVEGTDPANPDRWAGDRSAAVWAVTCELARRRVPPGLIVGILTDKSWGISAHVRDQKRAEEYAWRQVEKAYDEAEDNWPMHSVDAAVDWINKRYFAALEGKRITFYREQADKLFPMDKEAFAFELAGKDVIVGPPNKEQRLPAAQLWTRDRRRRYYPDGLLLDPGRPEDGRAYNLWRGFGVEPKSGDWSLMQDHIFNILANGNPDHASYITRFAAWCFQNPATPPRAALVFQGGEGVGKGVFAQAMMEAFGHHGLHVRSMSQVTGRFNSHLRHCCLLYADEAEATNPKEEGALKGLITERTLPCEGKGKDLIQVNNHIHLIMASNENWVVPAGKDSRRFAVFRVSTARQRDKAYFEALVQQMRNGGLPAMIHDMLAMDLSDFHPEHDRPDTDALAEQRAASLRGFDRVWFDVLRSGDMPPLYSSKRVGVDSVFVATTEFRDFAMQKMRREDLTVSEVGGLFGRLGFEKVDSGRPRGWIVPPLKEARGRWDATSFAMPWDATATWAVDEQHDAEGPY